MVKYQWADGARPPKGLSAEVVGEALEKMAEPSPESLFEASKSEAHPLHSFVWSEGDQVWANRGRLDFCRKIISSVHRVDIVGGKSISYRAVECVAKKWHPIDKIVGNAVLESAFEEDILRQIAVLHAKMERYFSLKKK